MVVHVHINHASVFKAQSTNVALKVVSVESWKWTFGRTLNTLTVLTSNTPNNLALYDFFHVREDFKGFFADITALL